MLDSRAKVPKGQQGTVGSEWAGRIPAPDRELISSLELGGKWPFLRECSLGGVVVGR